MATAQANLFGWPVKTAPARLCPLLADLGLGGMFLYAGLIKIWPPGGLAETITAYRLLPEAMVPPTAYILPWWEVAWALVLLSRRWTGPARAVLIGLMLLYSGAALSAWWRSLSAACGCFGGEGVEPGYVVIRNAAIVAVLSSLWALGRRFSQSGKETP